MPASFPGLVATPALESLNETRGIKLRHPGGGVITLNKLNGNGLMTPLPSVNTLVLFCYGIGCFIALHFTFVLVNTTSQGDDGGNEY